MQEPAKCCGKRRYRSRPQAEKALRKWQAIRGDQGPVRPYRCDKGFWHLTHMPKSEYNRRQSITPKEQQERRELMRAVLVRDGHCLVCGGNSGILSIHPRVKLTPINDRSPSTYITAHHGCLHHGDLSGNEKFKYGYQLDAHMTREAELYPVLDMRASRWFYLNDDGTRTSCERRVKREKVSV